MREWAKNGEIGGNIRWTNIQMIGGRGMGRWGEYKIDKYGEYGDHRWARNGEIGGNIKCTNMEMIGGRGKGDRGI